MTSSDVTSPPRTAAGRVRQVGPGLLVAAAGVGAGDLVVLLLNSRRVDPAGRSGWISNVLLSGSTVLFFILLVNEIRTQLG